MQRLNRMVKDGSFYRLSQEKRHMLIHRVERLKRQLGLRIKLPGLKHTLAAATLVAGLGFTSAAQAQQFATPVTNPFGITPAASEPKPAFADFDNDGDLDLLMGSDYGEFYYYQNTGTNTSPQFGSAVENPFGLQTVGYYSSPAVADLDDDGDYDILAGVLYVDMTDTSYYGELFYFENTGSASSPQFSLPVQSAMGILTPTGYELKPTFGDIDNDGDFDLFVAEGYYGDVFYYQNTGTATNPTFSAPTLNPFGIQPVAGYSYQAPSFGDIDQDGDLDLLVGTNYGDLLYYQNTGTATSPTFASATVNPWNISLDGYLVGPTFVDLDADGDLDLAVGEIDYYGSNLVYFENVATGCSTPAMAATPIGDAAICQDAPDEVYATSTAVNAAKYEWELTPATAGTITGTDTTAIIDWSSTFTGSASITVRGVNACGDPGSFSSPFTILVNPTPPAPSITANAGVLTSSAATAYQWYMGGTLIPGATGQTYEPTQDGIYRVVITNSNGCTAESDPYNFTITGLSEGAERLGLSIKPNPSNGRFFVESKLEGNNRVELTDLQGRQVLEGMRLQQGTNRIDASELTPGVYFMRFILKDGYYIEKVVIQ